MTSLTRGPLPARVYWMRRVVVVGAALLLVFGIARVLTLGSDASSKPPQARQVAADLTPTESPTASGPKKAGKSKSPGKGKASQKPVLAEPDGPCDDEDIAVTPQVTKSVAGPTGSVFIVLGLRTLVSEACTWRVSPDTLTLKISSGKDDIWSSRQCPRAIPVRELVVRRAVNTTVGVSWTGRRSDEGCSRVTDWALPGYYHVSVAALAGEPADEQFELSAPTGPVITTSPSPTSKPSTKPSTKPSRKPQGAKHSGRPQTEPSGATEPSSN